MNLRISSSTSHLFFSRLIYVRSRVFKGFGTPGDVNAGGFAKPNAKLLAKRRERESIKIWKKSNRASYDNNGGGL